MGLFLEPGKRIPVEVEGVTFWVKTLTAREQLRLVEHAEHLTGKEITASDLEHVFEVLRLGIAGWEGSPQPLAESDLDTIPVHVWASLAAHITEANHLSVPEQGNSSSPSDTASGS